MGQYRSSVLKDYTTEYGSTEDFTFAGTQITGWRISQEDRIVCLPKFYQGYSLFGVFDGHGGEEVAEYLKHNLPKHIADMLESTDDVELALYTAFFNCDFHLRNLNKEEVSVIEDAIIYEYEPSENDSSEIDKERGEIPSSSRPVVTSYDSNLQAGILKAVNKFFVENPDKVKMILTKNGLPRPSTISHEDGDQESSDWSTESSSEDENNCSSKTTTSDKTADIIEVQNNCDAPDKDEGSNSVTERRYEGQSMSLVQEDSNKNIVCKTLEAIVMKVQNNIDMLDTDKNIEPFYEEKNEECVNNVMEIQTNLTSGKDKENFSRNKSSIQKVQNAHEGTEKDSENSIQLIQEKVCNQDINSDSEGSNDTAKPLIGFNCGSTATVVMIKEKKIFISSIGDSRCVASVNGQAVDLTTDHVPESEEEQNRILKFCKIKNGRINGLLNISRAFGDFRFKSQAVDELTTPVICEPSIASITKENVDFIIIASDGIWNIWNGQDIVDFVSKYINNMKLCDLNAEIFELLLPTEAADDADNMSIIIINFMKTSYVKYNAENYEYNYTVIEKEKQDEDKEIEFISDSEQKNGTNEPQHNIVSKTIKEKHYHELNSQHKAITEKCTELSNAQKALINIIQNTYEKFAFIKAFLPCLDDSVNKYEEIIQTVNPDLFHAYKNAYNSISKHMNNNNIAGPSSLPNGNVPYNEPRSAHRQFTLSENAPLFPTGVSPTAFTLQSTTCKRPTIVGHSRSNQIEVVDLIDDEEEEEEDSSATSKEQKKKRSASDEYEVPKKKLRCEKNSTEH